MSRPIILVLVAAGGRAADGIDFSRDVRPILSDACFRCHGPDPATREAKLRLDQREGIFRTREDVTVVAPGKPEASELVLRIKSQDEDEVMPPRDAARQLTAAERNLLVRWVASGAPWGTHWAFGPPRRPEPPAVSAPMRARVRNPIDQFVFARLGREKLAPSPEASRETLLRRVTLDLTGLPPTPPELAVFLADRSDDAYERAVDRLLASPRYGERWAWEWLDAARYADTNGFQADPERTMWPWRDWVVNAINANMPFDQFSIEQLAGDLLPNASPEQKLATGFNRNHMVNGEGGRIPEETRVENVFDRVETTATIWLGLTFTCARCHDHKYDPIAQRDYYSLYDIFNQMSETGDAVGGAAGRSGQIAPVLDMSSDEERTAFEAVVARHAEAAREVAAMEKAGFGGGPPDVVPESGKTEPAAAKPGLFETEPPERTVGALRAAIKKLGDDEPAYSASLRKLMEATRARDGVAARVPRVMIMDQLQEPRETFVLQRGSYEKKTDQRVFGAIPSLFRSRDAAVPEGGSRINRLELARWLVSPGNPLAARTAANRAWQTFFGTGIVKTAEDFGVQSEPPSHPELLDWLATEFVARGWDMKALHRLIVTSATYRQSARATRAAYENDPENRLLARGGRFRLPSWMLRDQALAVSDLLVEKRGGPGVNVYQPAGVWEEATFGKKTYRRDRGEALHRRSLYVFWRRITGPTTFFDSGARQVCTVRMNRTNTPLHALVTLNDTTYVEAARAMAQRILDRPESDSERIDRAFVRVTARQPTPTERTILLGRLKTLRSQFAAEPAQARELASVGEAPHLDSLDPIEHAAWTALCSLLLNLDEVLSKE